MAWYGQNARDLPWRRTRDPYAIWVSEIMLQQTRVETVVPYFERFLRRFPDVRALARATEDAVLREWSGLGYYRRARMLHAGAKKVVAEHGSRVPGDAEERRAIPGIGRYTAAAIGSIAFGCEEALVDGNVARVFARLFGIETPLGTRETEQALWSRADALIPGPDPGALNQAVMELGATVCTPISPGCGACPVRRFCHAFETGRTDALPVPKERRAPSVLRCAAVVPRDRAGNVWLIKGDAGLFGGMFGVPLEPGSTVADARRALVRAGMQGEITREPVGHVSHVLTHRRLEVVVFEAVDVVAKRSATRRAFPSVHGAPVGIAAVTKKIVALSVPRR